MSDQDKPKERGNDGGWFTVFLVVAAIAALALVCDIPLISGFVELIVGLTVGILATAFGLVVGLAAAILGLGLGILAFLVSVAAAAGALIAIALPLLVAIALLIGIGFLIGRGARRTD